jgi:hypothetical protein
MTPAINPFQGFSVIAGVVDTGEKFIAGDNDTSDNFIPGDNKTGEQLTRTVWRWGAAKDRRKLKGINRRNPRPPKSSTAANGIIGTAMKSCIHTHPTHLGQRPKRPPKLNNAILV